jgi:hypothetical protein
MSNDSFTFIDVTGRVLPTGVRVIQRVSRRPLRWLCVCEKCGSERIFDHSKVIAAIDGAQGNVAQCDLSNCRLFGTATKPIPPHARERSDKPESVTLPTAIPAPVHKPSHAHSVATETSQAYERYVEQMRAWGNPNIAPWKDFRMLDGANLARIMKAVEDAERKRDGEAHVARLEAEERERLRRVYGI